MRRARRSANVAGVDPEKIDPGGRFREAIEDYLVREGASVDAYAEEVQNHVPFKQAPPGEDCA